MIVDCLLPPKVRRLGRQSTYLAPRQPIRTTAVECRIRGGEYTEPDQANLGTALKVWLPQAQAGDAEAQYYVGQMFEKGLGVPPDFAAAASWYLKAAEQGYGAAQVALGSLYETGRGVPEDEQEALRWYRRAAGLAEDLVVLQGVEYEELTAAEEQLGETQEQLEQQRRRVEELEQEVEQLERRPVDEGPQRGEIDFGRYHALIIGNSSYASLADLPTAREDAQWIADLLRQRYGFEVRLLLDATRLEIMIALNELRERLTSQDNLLVYYSGHATRTPDGRTAYWQPVDAAPDSPANWIPSELVSDHLDLIPARHVMVVADALFSGLRTRSGVAQLPRGMTEEERYHALRLLREKRSRLVLASGMGKPLLPAAEAEHSAFATAFVEALRSNEGVLESTRLYRLVNQRLSDMPGVGRPVEYGPMQWARAEVSEFFFVRPS